MAYKIDIEWNFDREPFCDAFGTQSISFMLGYDLVLNTTFFMVVRLATSGVYDLRFGIEERDNDKPDWKCGTAYDIEESKRRIPTRHRSAVLDLVISAVEVIIAKCTPKKVTTMQSYHRNIPEKAMKKYIKISENMKKFGYDTTMNTKDRTSAIHYWLYEKNEGCNCFESFGALHLCGIKRRRFDHDSRRDRPMDG